MGTSAGHSRTAHSPTCDWWSADRLNTGHRGLQPLLVTPVGVVVADTGRSLRSTGGSSRMPPSWSAAWIRPSSKKSSCKLDGQVQWIFHRGDFPLATREHGG